jgi:hypothetical protein
LGRPTTHEVGLPTLKTEPAHANEIFKRLKQEKQIVLCELSGCSKESPSRAKKYQQVSK